MGCFLEVTTIIGCNAVCEYCPQDKFIKAYKSDIKVLSLDIFQTVIDKIPDNSDISFAGFSEPCRNPYIAEMIEYASDRGHNIYLLTNLCGLTIETYNKLKQHLHYFSIHLPDSNGKTKINITNDYIELLKYINNNPPNCGIIYNHHSGTLHELLKDININSYVVPINDRANNLNTEDDVLKNYNQNIKYCGHRFLMTYPDGGCMLLCDGSVYLCCMDWSLENKLGNLIEQSWDEIKRNLNIKELCKYCVLGK